VRSETETYGSPMTKSKPHLSGQSIPCGLPYTANVTHPLRTCCVTLTQTITGRWRTMLRMMQSSVRIGNRESLGRRLGGGLFAVVLVVMKPAASTEAAPATAPSSAPECTYRHVCGPTAPDGWPTVCESGNSPTFVNCGPGAGVLPRSDSGSLVYPPFCDDRAFARSGSFVVGTTPLDPASLVGTGAGQWFNVSTALQAAGIRASNGIYQPPNYQAAADGRVALVFFTGAFQPRSSFKVEGILDHLIGRGEIPYALGIFLNVGTDIEAPVQVIANIRAAIPLLQQTFPKISNDPGMRTIIGQSVQGSLAFEVAWMGTDVIGTAIGGSPYFACFTCTGIMGLADGDRDGNINDIPTDWVGACPVKPLRWSATIGSCDIFGTLHERLAAGCPADTHGGAVDASHCSASLLPINQRLHAALTQKGIPSQLFISSVGGHSPGTWSLALADQLRFVFRPYTCGANARPVPALTGGGILLLAGTMATLLIALNSYCGKRYRRGHS